MLSGNIFMVMIVEGSCCFFSEDFKNFHRKYDKYPDDFEMESILKKGKS